MQNPDSENSEESSSILLSRNQNRGETPTSTKFTESENEEEEEESLNLNQLQRPDAQKGDAEMNKMMEYISRYVIQPQELSTVFHPFFPELIPSIGDIDAFIKIESLNPNIGKELGLNVIDEPSSLQSEPTVLDLQLRVLTKTQILAPQKVKSININAIDSSPLDAWILNISELHQKKSINLLKLQGRMPDIEQLLQLWPDTIEKTLATLNTPMFDCSIDLPLNMYLDLIMSILDIPVFDNGSKVGKIGALNVLLTLYAEFKNSSHFQ